MLQARGSDGPLEIELGREEPAARLQRFIAAHGGRSGCSPARARPIDHVDLRHRNGFAARVPGFKERPPKRAAN